MRRHGAENVPRRLSSIPCDIQYRYYHISALVFHLTSLARQWIRPAAVVGRAFSPSDFAKAYHRRQPRHAGWGRRSRAGPWVVERRTRPGMKKTAQGRPYLDFDRQAPRHASTVLMPLRPDSRAPDFLPPPLPMCTGAESDASPFHAVDGTWARKPSPALTGTITV